MATKRSLRLQRRRRREAREVAEKTRLSADDRRSKDIENIVEDSRLNKREIVMGGDWNVRIGTQGSIDEDRERYKRQV